MSRIIGHGAPTSNTMGVVGQEYFDVDSSTSYTCVRVTYDNHTTLTGEMKERCEWAPSASGMPEGGNPHQMLVTNAEGKAEWQERLAYKSEGWVYLLKEYSTQYVNGVYTITDGAILDIKAGESCIVTYGGIDYECTATGGLSYNGIPLICLGNAAQHGGEDTGEPFLINIFFQGGLPSPAGVYYGSVIYMDFTLGPPIISVQHRAEVVEKVPDEYIPAQDWDAAEGEPGHIKNRTHYGTIVAGDTLLTFEATSSNTITSPGTGETLQGTVAYPVGFVVDQGKVFFVSFNGAQYKCVVSNCMGALAMGNASYIDGSEDTGEPFLMAFQPGPSGYGLVVYTPQQIDAVPVSILAPGVSAQKQLDPAYIPDNSCFLTSPNGTRYQITVSDDGILTATAIT